MDDHPRWTPQQDNHPVPWGKKAQDYPQSHDWGILKWPARSPDLSPIGGVWGPWGQKIHKDRPHNLQELGGFIFKWWGGLKPGYPPNLYGGAPDCPDRVIFPQGDTTPY